MGLKDLFTGSKQDTSCCGAQIVPDDDDHPQGEQSTVANTPAPTAPSDEDLERN